MSKIYLKTKPDFKFKQTLTSHGWSELLPFRFDTKNWRLSLVLRVENPIELIVSEKNNQLEIKVLADLNNSAAQTIKKQISHIFRIDENLAEFYELLKPFKNLEWIHQQKAGRLLRSATVFEDLVKTICTTNCNWALTKIMVSNLVEKLGEPALNGVKLFPTAEKMAEQSPDFYTQEIRAGYRAAYLQELAEKTAAGKLNPQEWLKSELPTSELKQQLKQIKGVGDYAAENLLKLLGRYDGLALDSWLRGKFYKKYNNGQVCDDKIIKKHYQKFGKWKGLVIWCEMTGI